MLDKLGVSGLLGLLVMLGGVALVASQNLYVAAGIALVVAGLGLVVNGLARNVMAMFGMA